MTENERLKRSDARERAFLILFALNVNPDMDLEERKKLPGLQPGRADIVVHGICILLAVMTHLEIGEITVSEWGNMDGYLRRKLCGGKEN